MWTRISPRRGFGTGRSTSFNSSIENATASIASIEFFEFIGRLRAGFAPQYTRCMSALSFRVARGVARDLLGLENDGPVDHPAIDSHGRAARALRGIEYRAGPRDLRLARGKRGIDGRNLSRMNAQLAAETEPARALRIRHQQHLIFPRRARSVDRGLEAGKPGRQDESRAKGQQLVAVAVDAEFELEIDGAEHQALYARGGSDGLRLGHADSRLDQGEKCDAPPATQRNDALVDFLRLGNNNAGHAVRVAGHQIAVEPFRPGGIDSHQYGFCRRKPGSERRASRIFFRGRHRILEIDDDSIGTRRARFVEAIRAITRNVKVGTRS